MLRSVSLAVMLCALSPVVAGGEVLEFTGADFDERVKSFELLVIKFYAPWCGHCKKLAPEYEKAAEDLKKTHPDIGVAKVDCDANSDLCSKYEVRGYPTLKIFRNGELTGDYEGPRDSNGIVRYIRSLHGPSSTELNTLADLKKFIDDKTLAVVGFFEKDSKLKDSFLKVADIERIKFRFAHTSADEVLSSEKFKDDVVVYSPKSMQNKFEEPRIVYDGNFDVNRIKKFLHTDIHGLCGHRTTDNAEDFKKPTVIAFYDVDFERNAKSTNYIRNRIMMVAKDHRRELTFAVSDKEEFRADLASSGLLEEVGSKKVMVIAFNEQNRKFIMKEDFSVDALRKFVESFLKNELEPFVKSEPVPESNDGPVTVVVGTTFEEIVNADKDVLLEFYAPWCGHCKNLAPIYEELGTKMKDEDVVIAKMDATANEVPLPYNVEGFPTIYFKKANDKEHPKRYTGGRDIDSFVKFLAKEATNELNGWDRKGNAKKGEL